MYFWEDDEEERRDPFQLTMANLPSGNFARSIAGAPSAAASPMLPPITKSPASLYDGFHDTGGYETMPPQMAPGFGRQPGGGYAGGGEHALDSLFNNGMANPGRVWTEADLEPLSVGSFGGFNFTKAARPYAQDNPNLPLFRADMANRAQMTNFAAELAASKNRMDFQSMEGDKDRANRLAIADMTMDSRKDQGLAMAGDQRQPFAVRDQSVNEMEKKGSVSPEEAARLRAGILFEKAEKFGGPKNSPGYWNYIQQNGGSIPGLAGEMAKYGADANKLWQWGTSDVPFWASPNPFRKPDEEDIEYFYKTRGTPEQQARYGFAKKNVK